MLPETQMDIKNQQKILALSCINDIVKLYRLLELKSLTKYSCGELALIVANIQSILSNKKDDKIDED